MQEGGGPTQLPQPYFHRTCGDRCDFAPCARDTLVNEVKKVQRSGQAGRQRWKLYCDSVTSGNRDPMRHTLSSIQHFLESWHRSANPPGCARPAELATAEAVDGQAATPEKGSPRKERVAVLTPPVLADSISTPATPRSQGCPHLCDEPVAAAQLHTQSGTATNVQTSRLTQLAALEAACLAPAMHEASCALPTPSPRAHTGHASSLRLRTGRASDADLASAQGPRTHDKSKLALCKFFAQGRCRYGTFCTYAHGKKDLRSWHPDLRSGGATASGNSATNGSKSADSLVPSEAASALPAVDPVDCTEAAGAPTCLLYTSPSPRDRTRYRMPSSA